MRKTVVIGMVLVALSATGLLAGEGRIPIFAPVVLNAALGPIDGRYILTRNIVQVAGGGPAILVLGTGFEEVDIDLNGFTVFGDPGGGSDIISASSLRSFVVRDGSIRAQGPPPGDSVHVLQTVKAIIEDLRIEDGSGIAVGQVQDYAIRRNIVVGASLDAISADGGAVLTPHTGIVENNEIRDCQQGGITIINGSSAVIIRLNRVDTAGTHGIGISQAEGCLVAENTVEHSGTGISLDQVGGCKVQNNVLTANQLNGIDALGVGEVLFLDNVSTGNGGSGILNGGTGNHFDRNVLTGNRCYGLWLTGTLSTFGRNTARGNFGGPIAGLCPGGPGLDCPVAPPAAAACWPLAAPPGPGLAPPDLCLAGAGNTTFCDNLMPGPPTN